MRVTSLTHLPPQAAPALREPASLRSRPGNAREPGAWRALGRKLDADDPRQRREAAVGLASELFFAPLLAEMRKLPFGKGVGFGGRLEEAFAQQLDTELADHVSASDPGGLLKHLEAKLDRLRPVGAANGDSKA